MPQPEIEQRYFTLAEAAGYLRKSVSSLRAAANTQDPDEFIPSIRDGRLIKFDRVDLDAYMERKKTA